MGNKEMQKNAVMQHLHQSITMRRRRWIIRLCSIAPPTSLAPPPCLAPPPEHGETQPTQDPARVWSRVWKEVYFDFEALIFWLSGGPNKTIGEPRLMFKKLRFLKFYVLLLLFSFSRFSLLFIHVFIIQLFIILMIKKNSVWFWFQVRLSPGVSRLSGKAKIMSTRASENHGSLLHACTHTQI